MRRLPPLSSLRAFEAAARHHSFKQAAKELAVTPTAISHQIRSLEDLTGVKLFERRTRQVMLTPQAERLYPVLRDGFDAFAEAIECLTNSRSRPVVTISATMAFISKWLVPRVARFQTLHTDIDLQLHASDDPIDFGATNVDLAIRYGRGPYPGLNAEPMLTDQFAPVANPNIAVRGPDDLRRVPLIHFEWRRADPANPTWSAWFREEGVPEIEPASHLRFSDESHAIQAAVAGQGVALLSLLLVRDELDAGRLKQPFGPIVEGMTYHLVEPLGRSRPDRVQAVRHWLMTEVTLPR
jgi:LysR family glycine cleavage system transcriptional activator